mmetsp:Transcript_31486/g.51991  ORF Transcript_31486/g.51991 Transcript_31486/m.51991 type:complete len:259 (-) Transcript_31486:191-967(-)|eukprot:CAMPEP_0119014546 /NCGR_PEP_ID=MMETSP1176-20130426/9918_1 /TAXON_ID=265551 /ORGANISM="Synedropsis recta cf, Strain CCMP1620" /LENGTH=258 /DNA_ID=CAMNT_0006967737 /DNA_START=89 /DNA_END=865 /DNA_ORIENTATION=+
MAAVICGSIGDLCRGCGDVVCLPCKACGVGCKSLCEVVGSPFFPYLLTTFGLNIPVFALGIQSIPDLIAGNCTDESGWMVAASAFSAIHMVASLYICHKIREEKNDDFVHVNNTTTTTTTTTPAPKMTQVNVYGGEKEAPEPAVVATPVPNTTQQTNNLESGTLYQKMYEGGAADDGDHMTWGRIKQVLCYDKWVAVYICITIVWILWQTMGVGTYFKHDDDDCGDVANRMLTSLFCGWFYMSLVGVAFLCSMCCMRL